MFIIVFLAMIMLTLRVGFYELQEEDEEARHKCMTLCCGLFSCCSCRRALSNRGDNNAELVEGDDKVLETETEAQAFPETGNADENKLTNVVLE